MPTNENTPERPFVIVLGLDLSDQESSGYAFEQAMRIASSIERCQMHVVHVVASNTSDEEVKRVAGLLDLYARDATGALRLRGPRAAGLHVRSGDPAKEIAQLAADAQADMIIVGTRKKTRLQGLFAGSTAERVMAASTCPVFVAGPRPKVEPSHVIVIEPPCPDCVARRNATAGHEWWCARHAERHHVRRHHLYHYASEYPFETAHAENSPTGG